MKDNNKHKAQNKSFLENSAYSPKLEVKWEKSKDDIWNDMFDALPEKKTKKGRIISINVVRYVAAVVLLAILIPSVMRFYSKTVVCPNASRITCYLPDGSEVILNAGSELSYNPLWWKFSRKVNFSGEGFFKVKKGEKFMVESNHGVTSVLGTSFNIYSRGTDYKVTCVTGKVKVEAKKIEAKQAILTPNEKVEISSKRKTVRKLKVKPESSTAWMKNKFVFTSEPIKNVLNEISRQYNIKIVYSSDLNHSYTGNFAKHKDVDQVLNLVCRPFGIKFVKTPENEIHIKTN